MADYISLDLETTHFKRKYADIVEIGAVAFSKAPHGPPVIVSTFNVVVKPPKRDIWETGAFPFALSQEELDRGVSFKRAWAAFSNWKSLHCVPHATVVGHNVRHYDLPLLKRHCMEHQMECFEPENVLDTFAWSRSKRVGDTRRLEDVYKHVQTASPGAEEWLKSPDPLCAHRALSDAKMSCAVACHVLNLEETERWSNE